MLSEIHVAGRLLDLNAPSFAITETSSDHNQLLERALEIVEVVAKAGAHALKIQALKS